MGQPVLIEHLKEPDLVAIAFEHRPAVLHLQPALFMIGGDRRQPRGVVSGKKVPLESDVALLADSSMASIREKSYAPGCGAKAFHFVVLPGQV